MTFWTAIKTYKASVFWSMAISATLIMEGYDTSLLGNAMAVPAFRQHYGYYLDAKNGYQLNPAWQSAVQNAPTIGAVM
jgi:SP family general alpha glucoside:H+ symporter-like MFS transporter